MRSRRRNAPNVPTSLHRSASASNRRFSLPEKLRRLAIATTSGSRRAASGETISPVALRAPSATVSPEEPDNPSKEDFNNEVMCMSYLYSKLPETGVSPHIDTGGSEQGSTYNTYSRPQQNSASVSGPSLWVYVDRAALTYAPCSLHLLGQLDRTADAKAACERSHDRKTNRL